MSKYLNDIESDLYKLHSIVDVAGDSVPEMVGELKEKYEKAEAFDLIREAMDYHYPTVNDRKYLNGYQHPKASLKDIDAIINSYERGEQNER